MVHAGESVIEGGLVCLTVSVTNYSGFSGTERFVGM